MVVVEPNEPELPSRPSHGFLWLMVLFTTALNTLLLVWAAEDQSWGALGIALIFGPSLNGILALVAAISVPMMGLVSPQRSAGSLFAQAIGIPLLAIVVDFLVIVSMPLHGC